VFSLLPFPAFPRRNRETERGAFARRRLDPDASAVPFHDLFANRQADAGAGIFRFGMKALEDDEDAFAMLR
jgi:hypothetical protein